MVCTELHESLHHLCGKKARNDETSRAPLETKYIIKDKARLDNIHSKKTNFPNTFILSALLSIGVESKLKKIKTISYTIIVLLIMMY